jgi:hypothetical protein
MAEEVKLAFHQDSIIYQYLSSSGAYGGFNNGYGNRFGGMEGGFQPGLY